MGNEKSAMLEGALIGAALSPKGHRWAGAGHGAARHMGIGTGASLGGMSGLLLGGIPGALAGSPGLAMLGTAAGGLAGAGLGGYGGHHVGRILAEKVLNRRAPWNTDPAAVAELKQIDEDNEVKEKALAEHKKKTKPKTEKPEEDGEKTAHLVKVAAAFSLHPLIKKAKESQRPGLINMQKSLLQGASLDSAIKVAFPTASPTTMHKLVNYVVQNCRG